MKKNLSKNTVSSEHMKAKHKEDERITLTVSKSTMMLAIGLVVGLFVGFLSGYFLNEGGATGSLVGPGANDNGANAAPQRVQVSTDDDPVMGDKDAPLTIIEFSDYECPFCQRFWKETLPQLKANYIDTGKVKFVYRDFPLSFHPNAEPAAIAAECAREQGENLYWTVHDKIFEKQSSLGSGIVEILRDVPGLDTAKLQACIDSRKYTDEVSKDFLDGQAAGVQGTPSFFIGNDKDGYIQVEGAQPYAVFKQVLDAELK